MNENINLSKVVANRNGLPLTTRSMEELIEDLNIFMLCYDSLANSRSRRVRQGITFDPYVSLLDTLHDTRSEVAEYYRDMDFDSPAYQLGLSHRVY